MSKMKTCKIRILSGSEKKIKDTPITYIACSSFPESMASVTTSTDGKRGVFRSVTTSHGRQDMCSKYETQLWTFPFLWRGIFCCQESGHLIAG